MGEFLKQALLEIKRELRDNRKRKTDLNQQAMDMVNAPVKRQVTAFEEQIGSFTPVRVSTSTARDTPVSSVTEASSMNTAEDVANTVVNALANANDGSMSP